MIGTSSCWEFTLLVVKMNRLRSRFILILSILSCLTLFFFGCDSCEACKTTVVYTKTVEISIGDTYSLLYDELGSDLTYASEDVNIVSVDEAGLITAVGVGETKVIVKREDLNVLICTVIVSEKVDAPEEKEDPVQDNYRIVLDRTDVRIYGDGNAKILATVYNNRSLSKETVQWVAERSDVVDLSVDNNSVIITPKSTGETRVIARIGENFTAYCKVKCIDEDCVVLNQPQLTDVDITSNIIQWEQVDNASGYLISEDGTDYKELDTTTTQYSLPQGINPLNVFLIAKGDYADYDDSAVLQIKDLLFYTGEEQVNVCLNKTLSGADNNKNTEKSFDDLTVSIQLKDDTKTIDASLMKWKVDDESVASITAGNIVGVKMGKTTISSSFLNQNVEIIVNTPMSSKNDLDELSRACQNNNYNLWMNNAYYFMTEDIDYGGQYLMPIASKRDFKTVIDPVNEYNQDADAPMRHVAVVDDVPRRLYWGIFGALNPNFYEFYATFNGNGHSINNAVIACGTMLGYFGGGVIEDVWYDGMLCVFSNNFIGELKNGGTLKNTLFNNLHFETPNEAKDKQIYQDFKKKTGIDIADAYSSAFFTNYSMSSGLVGMANGGNIENVYLDTALSYRKYGDMSIGSNGALVGLIDNNADFNSNVLNCVIRVAYDVNYNVNLADAIRGGNGAIAGKNLSVNNETLKNCFVITYADSERGLKKVGADGYDGADKLQKAIYSYGASDDMNYTNCVVYTSIRSLVVNQKALSGELGAVWEYLLGKTVDDIIWEPQN